MGMSMGSPNLGLFHIPLSSSDVSWVQAEAASGTTDQSSRACLESDGSWDLNLALHS